MIVVGYRASARSEMALQPIDSEFCTFVEEQGLETYCLGSKHISG